VILKGRLWRLWQGTVGSGHVGIQVLVVGIPSLATVTWESSRWREEHGWEHGWEHIEMPEDVEIYFWNAIQCNVYICMYIILYINQL